MNMEFSLLYNECIVSKNKTDYDVFINSGLTAILSDATINILRVPCKIEEIMERQQIFRALDDDVVYASFFEISSLLAELNRLYVHLDKLESKLQINLVFAKILKKQLDIIDCILLLPGSSKLITTLQENINIVKNNLDEHHEQISTYFELSSSISEFSISAQNGGAKFSKMVPARTILDEISLCCEKLGVPISNKDKSSYDTIGQTEQYINALFEIETTKMDDLRVLISQIIYRNIVELKTDIDFYLEIKGIIDKVKTKGIPICFPDISRTIELHADEMYYLNFILDKEMRDVVPNDVHATTQDNVFFITGANGGGKTSYIRMIISNLILFLAGCPILCKNARIYPFEHVFSHFPANEQSYGKGRFYEEVERAKRIVSVANARTVIFFNETFSGTNEDLAQKHALEIMGQLKSIGAVVFFVTHFSPDPEKDIPILAAVVNIFEDNKRTYKIKRIDTASASYAQDILKKYGLDEDSLRLLML